MVKIKFRLLITFYIPEKRGPEDDDNQCSKNKDKHKKLGVTNSHINTHHLTHKPKYPPSKKTRTYELPGSVFLAGHAVLQCPQMDPDVPSGRITCAQLYWCNTKSNHCSLKCMLFYAEQDPADPVTAILYYIETTICTNVSHHCVQF